jgi:hypothetical protein
MIHLDDDDREPARPQLGKGEASLARSEGAIVAGKSVALRYGETFHAAFRYLVESPAAGAYYPPALKRESQLLGRHGRA